MTSLEFLSLDIPEDIKRYIIYGDFDTANKLIDIYLKRNITDKLKDRLVYEKNILKTLKNEYIYNFEKTLTIFQENIRDFTREELIYLKDERYTDWIFLDGQVMFHQSVFKNTAKVHPTIRQRLNTAYIEEDMENYTKKIVKEIIDTGSGEYNIHIKRGLKIKEDSFIPMKKLFVHLPIPKETRSISNIEILKYSLEPKHVSCLELPQRTVFFEEELNYNIPFTVEYRFDSKIEYRTLDLEKVSLDQPDFHTEEFLPHIKFSPYLVDLAQTIVGESRNPLEKARKIYDYITQNVQYSFMRSYSSLYNIPEYAAYNLKGDCGVQALLFITLCRIVGIPSKWQSGLITNPYKVGAHDWAEFYIAPYGWLYADLSFGGMSLRLGEPDLWNFYFGHIDPLRVVFNSDIQQNFDPPKEFLRDDPYDNQYGEMEYIDRGIYSNEYDIISDMISIQKI